MIMIIYYGEATARVTYVFQITIGHLLERINLSVIWGRVGVLIKNISHTSLLFITKNTSSEKYFKDKTINN